MERPALTPSYLRIGEVLFPIYGDELRGWSPRAEDFADVAGSPHVYRSLDELFFALVNLVTGPHAELAGSLGLGVPRGSGDHLQRGEPSEG